MAETSIDLLLIDDDDIDREAVRRLLIPTYTVREAPTGKLALKMAKAHAPDCILLDYWLPDVDSLRLLPAFAKDYIPVIVLTGEERPEVIVQVMQQGAQDYLVKQHISKLTLEHAITNAIEKIALKRDVEEKNRQMRELTSALTLAEQRERRRISQILHDDVQHLLYGIQMRSHMIGFDAPTDSGIQEHLETLDNLVKTAIRTMRTLTVELSPPVFENEGLGPAFQWLANQMKEIHDLNVEVEIFDEYRMPGDDLRLLIFQLARELLFNVVKHAGIKHAKLTMFEQNNQCMICVSDDGLGFDREKVMKQMGVKGSFGLFSIRERLALFGGHLEIDSQTGAGVRATIVVPNEPTLSA